jgi:peptide/nickel transport system substrate-binding protein
LSYLKVPFNGMQAAMLSFNTQVYPTNITDVRLAIAHAINYSDLNDVAYFGTPYVGPTFPIFSDWYNLANLSTYSYNVTLAEQYLANSSITNFPTLSLTISVPCDVCVLAAQIIQGDLANIGINVNIVASATYFNSYGPYTYEVANAQQIGQLSLGNGGGGFSTADVDPAGAWVELVSCNSLFGNWAIYCNPTVQQFVNALISSSNVTQLMSMAVAAQKQVYDDAPYAWISEMGLWGNGGGSLVWKTGEISGFYLDPAYNGQNTIPIFNTVTFG